MGKNSIGLSVAEAAARAGLSAAHIRRRCLDGHLQAKKVGRDWIITPDDLTRFIRSPRQVGWPKGRPRSLQAKRRVLRSD